MLTLTLAWLFREYFGINPDTTVQLLEFMLWMAFYQSIFTLLRGEFFTTLQKWRDYRKGKIVASEMNGKSVADVGKELGLNTVITLVEKGTELRSRLAETKDEKKKDRLRAEIEALEKELMEAETEAI